MINKHILLQDSFSDEMGHIGISALEQEELFHRQAVPSGSSALSLEKNLFIKYRSSYSHACYDFVIHIFLLFLLFTYFNNFCCIMFLSLLNVKTFIILHDCGHHSYSPNKTLNYIIGIISGILIYTPFSWTFSHTLHHLTNGVLVNNYDHPYNETILHTLQEYKQFSLPMRQLYKCIRHPFVFFTIIPYLKFVIFMRFNALIIRGKLSVKNMNNFI